MKLPLSCVRFGGAFVVVTSITIVIMTEALPGGGFAASIDALVIDRVNRPSAN